MFSFIIKAIVLGYYLEVLKLLHSSFASQSLHDNVRIA